MIERLALRAWPTALLASLALLGCATPSQMPASPAPGGVSLSGRISIRVEPGPDDPATAAQSMTAQFELDGHPDDGLLSLSTPLGTQMARARWMGQRAELVGPDGKRKFGTLDALTYEALGQRVPVDALMSWLQGRPAAGAPSEPLPAPDQGFSQMNWRINLNRWHDRFILADHYGLDHTQVRVKLDGFATTN